MKFLINIYKTCTQPIDFHGQKLVKTLIYSIFTFGFILSLVIGIVFNDLKYTLFLGIATTILAVVITVPPWPIYRRNSREFKKKVKAE